MADASQDERALTPPPPAAESRTRTSTSTATTIAPPERAHKSLRDSKGWDGKLRLAPKSEADEGAGAASDDGEGSEAVEEDDGDVEVIAADEGGSCVLALLGIGGADVGVPG